MAYATEDDLQGYISAVPANAERLLERASALVDNAIRSAVYAVDEDGMPLDDVIADVLAQATCEQVTTWIGSGEDGTGASDQYTNVTLGALSLGRAASGGTNTSSSETLCPQARLVLDRAGLLGREPWTW